MTRPLRLPRRPALHLGISRCLLGDPVRYDGGHKRDHYLVEVLGKKVEWVPVCPEVEAGLGVPRPPMRLAGPARAPRLLTIATGADHTGTLDRFSRRRARELDELDLSGFVLKSRSPSCGLRQVPVYGPRGRVTRTGVGLFARAFTKRFPLVPVEDDERLADPAVRAHFVERVLAYARWRRLTRARVTRQALAAFHERHRHVLLAHSKPHHDRLSRLVRRRAPDRTGRPSHPGRIVQAYGQLFMEALAVRATARTQVPVLRDISSRFGGRVSPDESRHLHRAIAEYRRGRAPLDAPLALVARYARRLRLLDPALRTYLNPGARHASSLRVRHSPAQRGERASRATPNRI